MNKILKNYILIGEFISQIMGKNCEVLIHDISIPKSSIVWIDKGHISGRKIGDSLTDLSLKILHEKEYDKKNYIVNYEGLGTKGKKFISSTFFIKDESGKLCGLLCINKDITDFQEFRNQFLKIEKYFNTVNSKYKEKISKPIESLTKPIINDIISSQSIPAGRMKKKEKIEIVNKMKKRGVFNIKGGVSDAASSLNISETTLYRYLKKTNK